MHDRNKHLRKMTMWVFVAIMIVWVGVYQVVITGAFSRSFWASILHTQHQSLGKHPIEKLSLKQ